MGCDCEDCCRSCCYSTPFVTLSVVGFIVLSLAGFFLSGIFGTARLNDLPQLDQGTVVIAPIICGLFVLTIVPIVLVTIMAYCTTGYIRDMIFHSVVKACIGSNICSIIMVIIMMFFVLLWIGMVIGLSGIMVYGAQMEFICEARESSAMVNSTCIPFVGTDFNYQPICDESTISSICNSAEVRRSFYAALFFAVLVTMGLVMLSLVQMSNFVSGRDHIDYRESTRNEYDMKRVR